MTNIFYIKEHFSLFLNVVKTVDTNEVNEVWKTKFGKFPFKETILRVQNDTQYKKQGLTTSFLKRIQNVVFPTLNSFQWLYFQCKNACGIPLLFVTDNVLNF